MPDNGFLDDWAARLRQAADRAVVGIMLRGSHARRGATEHSDVDLDVLLCQPADEPRLEELIATQGKVAGASWADDPFGVRLAAARCAARTWRTPCWTAGWTATWPS